MAAFPAPMARARFRLPSGSAAGLLAILCAGCGETKAGGAGPAASANAPRPLVSSDGASASASAHASSSPAIVVDRPPSATGRGRLVPVGSPLGPIEVVRSERAGLAIVLAEDGSHATIVNEKTGEWRSLEPRREGETTVLETPLVKLAITGTAARRRLALTFGEGTARSFDATIVKLASHSATAAYAVDGEPLAPVALSASSRVLLGKTPAIWSGGFLPASPSLPPPSRLVLGARTIEPAPITLRREGPCAVVGFTPKAEGRLGEALVAAQNDELTKLCRGRAEATMVEASYGFVRFKGVNLERGVEADPTDAVGLELLFRATDATRSSLSETGYVVGLAKGEVASLASLLKPTGAAFLQKKAADPYGIAPPLLGALSPHDRAVALDLSRATLSLGPSTVDIVIPAEPFGLFLGARRVRLGPRYDVFPAFVGGPLTQRLVAPQLVAY